MSATKNQIIGGALTSIDGSSPVALGYLVVSLSQDCTANGNTLIASGIEIKVPLDASGNVVTDPPQYLWPNDSISPPNTFYSVSAYTAAGQLVWGPNSQQVLSSPSPFNIGAWIPAAINISSRIDGGAVSSVFGRTGDVSAEAGDYADFYEPIGSGSGAVSSVFGRRGAVVGQSGDYAASQIANAAATNVSNTFSQVQTFNGGLNATFGVFSSYITAPNLMNSFNGRSGSVVPVSGDYNVSQITGAAPLNSPAFTGTVTGLPFESLTTTGSSGAATLSGGVLNIPNYAGGAVTSLTTTGSSGAATLTSGVLNIPVYGGGGGSVSSVFGRTGAVVAASGDYTAAQVTNAAATNVSNTFTVQQTINSGSNADPLTVSSSSTLGAAILLDATAGGGDKYSFQSNGSGNGGPLFVVYDATKALNVFKASTTAFNIPTGSQFQINGVALASTNLSDTANLARLASPTFTGTVTTPALTVTGATATVFEGVAATGIRITPATDTESAYFYGTNAANSAILWRFDNGGDFSAPTIHATTGTFAGAITATAFNSAPISWTAIGNANIGGSLPASSTGNSNTATGQGALAANTTGTGNTAFGEAALNKNTAGAGNTAVGDGALVTNIVGNSNVAVGDGSLSANTADFNVAVGENCLPNNSSGSSNVGIGQSCMFGNTTASGNTGVGMTSLHDNVTGSSNTAIGWNSGYTTSVALQTISNSVFVGANAAASTDGLTNMVVLGTGAIGTASNQVTLGNSSVTSVVTAGVLTAASLATTQTATASSTASDHSIPIVIGGTTYYVRLSSTP